MELRVALLNATEVHIANVFVMPRATSACRRDLVRDHRETMTLLRRLMVRPVADIAIGVGGREHSSCGLTQPHPD